MFVHPWLIGPMGIGSQNSYWRLGVEIVVHLLAKLSVQCGTSPGEFGREEKIFSSIQGGNSKPMTIKSQTPPYCPSDKICFQTKKYRKEDQVGDARSLVVSTVT